MTNGEAPCGRVKNGSFPLVRFFHGMTILRFSHKGGSWKNKGQAI